MDIGNANIGVIHLQWAKRIVYAGKSFIQLSIVTISQKGWPNTILWIGQVNAWLNVPTDFVVVNENGARDYWFQVAGEFNAIIADNRGTQPIQIKRHWGKMNSEILLFNGMWRRVNDAFTATGESNHDLISKSLQMYKLEMN